MSGDGLYGPDDEAALLDHFARHRDRLFGIAYRMTGSVADAEDVCQDVWLKWSKQRLDDIVTPEAILVSITTRQCLDKVRSAAHRRETYIGPFLPEPLVGGLRATPEDAAEVADSMTFAFLLILDQLSPPERAAFLLHDVFGYSFNDIAAMLDRTPDAVRQMTSRSRRRIDAERSNYRYGLNDVTTAMVEAFIAAVATGDAEAAMALLAPDVVMTNDGGEFVRAARRPVAGADRVARFWVGLIRRVTPDMTFEFVEVNGLPGLLVRMDGAPHMVVEFAILEDGRIHRVTAQLNPAKLSHLA